MPQKDSAGHTEFARSYISRIERGKGNPSLDAVETLATGLKVPVRDLFE